MKKLFSLLFFFQTLISYSQLTFTEFPLDKQLVGRNLITNKGNVIVTGSVNNIAANYTSIEIDVFRNNVLSNTISANLVFTGNSAPFNFSIPITAELVNYKIQLYGKSGAVRTLEKEADSLVAGDVFVISGQSNALAQKYNSATTNPKNISSNFNQSKFIRVYANGDSDQSDLLNNNNWYVGQGDGDIETNGNTGQWGLKLAKNLVNSKSIPIAVFNAAHPGEVVTFFERPTNYQTSLNSNYSRLYYRLNKTGLKNSVRAVFWAQGESDGNGGSGTSIELYKNAFTNIKNAWKADYPNIEHIYIFQTKNSGCGEPNHHKVKEAQRQIASEDNDVSIMATAAIEQGQDDCHFYYTDGYERFADRIYPLMNRDIYGGTYTQEIDAPNIVDAYLTSATSFVIQTDATILNIATTATNFYLENAAGLDITNTITGITTSSNKIVFTTSIAIPLGSKISYLGQPRGTVGSFITNSANIEILCFYQYDINTSPTLQIDDLTKNKSISIYPNPTKDKISIKLSQYAGNVHFTLTNALGQKLIDKSYSSNTFLVNMPNRNGIYYITLKTENGIMHIKKILKI